MVTFSKALLKRSCTLESLLELFNSNDGQLEIYYGNVVPVDERVVGVPIAIIRDSGRSLRFHIDRDVLILESLPLSFLVLQAHLACYFRYVFKGDTTPFEDAIRIQGLIATSHAGDMIMCDIFFKRGETRFLDGFELRKEEDICHSLT